MYNLGFCIAPYDGMIEGGAKLGELEACYTIYQDCPTLDCTVSYHSFDRAKECKIVDKEEWKSDTLIKALLSAERHYETLVQTRQGN